VAQPVPTGGLRVRSLIRSNVRVVVAVVVTAALVGGGPSLAAMVFDAKNADKVDGIHAKKFTKKAKKRRKKLVATNKKGFLPNNIIRAANNARRLGGIGPTGYWRKTDSIDAATLGGLDAGAFAAAGHDHDGVYVPAAGDVLISAAPGAWQTPLTVVPVVNTIDPAVTYDSDGVSFAKAAAGSQTFSLYPDVPSAMYGKRLTLKGVELCYDADDVPGGVAITSAVANVVSQDGGGAPTAAPYPLLSGASDANCDYTEFVSPATLDVDDGVNLQIVATWTAPAAPLMLGRVTFVLSPTNQGATTPT